MQNIIYCNGPGLPDYPSNVLVKDVNVYIHDSGMIGTHDYSCPVCRTNHAVVTFDSGLMQPCWPCQKLGYKLIKVDKKSLLYRIKKAFSNELDW